MSEGHLRALDSTRPKDGGLGEPQGLEVQGHCSDHLRDSHGQPLAEPLPQASAPWLRQSQALTLSC